MRFLGSRVAFYVLFVLSFYGIDIHASLWSSAKKIHPQGEIIYQLPIPTEEPVIQDIPRQINLDELRLLHMKALAEMNIVSRNQDEPVQVGREVQSICGSFMRKEDDIEDARRYGRYVVNDSKFYEQQINCNNMTPEKYDHNVNLYTKGVKNLDKFILKVAAQGLQVSCCEYVLSNVMNLCCGCFCLPAFRQEVARQKFYARKEMAEALLRYADTQLYKEVEVQTILNLEPSKDDKIMYVSLSNKSAQNIHQFDSCEEEKCIRHGVTK